MSEDNLRSFVLQMKPVLKSYCDSLPDQQRQQIMNVAEIEENVSRFEQLLSTPLQVGSSQLSQVENLTPTPSSQRVRVLRSGSTPNPKRVRGNPRSLGTGRPSLS